MFGAKERCTMIFTTAYLLAVTTGNDYVSKRQSEVGDLTGNFNKSRHNALEPGLLPGNMSGSLVARTFIRPYVSDVPPLPVSIEVLQGSTLVSEPGRVSEVIFEVTSNLPSTTSFTFSVRDTSKYALTPPNPDRAYISSGSTVQSRVRLTPQSTSGQNPSTIIFTVWFYNLNYIQESVVKKAYFYVGTSSSDSSSPDIWYDFDGDCSGSVTPRNCEAKNWKATVNIQDKDSGLLSLRSDPMGIILDKEFIVGTKDVVTGTFSSSCCQTKVDITAVDTLGNVRIKTIDIEKRWLSAGDIAAIVLACILLVIIIAFVVWMIVKCCRRRRAKLSIYPSHTRRDES